jgi:hypothetical protein
MASTGCYYGLLYNNTMGSTLYSVQFVSCRSNALNEIATEPSPAAVIESRRCNPMMQNPASRIQNQRPGYSNYLFSAIFMAGYYSELVKVNVNGVPTLNFQFGVAYIYNL